MRKSIIYGLLTGAALLTATLPTHAKTDSLIVAGGCFWCVESDFEKLEGVTHAVSGYINGTTENPTYKEVSGKNTGHFEAVKITFDDEKITLDELVHYFWRTIDPTDPHGQFCDKGSPYKTALFYQNQVQQQTFNESLNALKADKPFAAPIVTEILPAKKFYPAEDYHQNYAKVNPVRYSYYRYTCGRDSKIKSLWGKVISKEQ
ncbi:MAG: peptide-methionine (S)-S-oxide reductase [Gammaproteobacteria bacterium]|nr:MAG: peptide-methionine (S)-S-oxide reductase [Gammaproteobacteria bacterium]